MRESAVKKNILRRGGTASITAIHNNARRHVVCEPESFLRPSMLPVQLFDWISEEAADRRRAGAGGAASHALSSSSPALSSLRLVYTLIDTDPRPLEIRGASHIYRSGLKSKY